MAGRKSTDFITCILLVSLILAVFYYGEWIGSEDSVVPEAKLGVPLFYTNESDLVHLKIEKVVDDGHYLYILFDDFQGILQIYNTEGIYLNSVAFYNRHSNGAFQMTEKDGTVYICDKRGNLYLFQDGSFVEYLSNENGAHLWEQIDFQSYSDDYIIRWESVWRVGPSGNVCIIERPILALLNRETLFFLGCGAIMAWGVYQYISRSKR